MAASVFVGITLVAVAGWLEGMAGGEIVRMIVLTLVAIFVFINLSVVMWMLCTDDDHPSVEDWKWGMDDSDVMEESEESDG